MLEFFIYNQDFNSLEVLLVFESIPVSNKMYQQQHFPGKHLIIFLDIKK